MIDLHINTVDILNSGSFRPVAHDSVNTFVHNRYYRGITSRILAVTVEEIVLYSEKNTEDQLLSNPIMRMNPIDLLG